MGHWSPAKWAHRWEALLASKQWPASERAGRSVAARSLVSAPLSDLGITWFCGMAPKEGAMLSQRTTRY
jgi:hypothetical protein